MSCAWSRLHSVTEQQESSGSCRCLPAEVTWQDKIVRFKLSDNSLEDVGRAGIENRGGVGWECAPGVGGIVELLGSGWGSCGVWRSHVLAIGGETLLWTSALHPGLEQTVHLYARPYLHDWFCKVHGDCWYLFHKRHTLPCWELPGEGFSLFF